MRHTPSIAGFTLKNCNPADYAKASSYVAPTFEANKKLTRNDIMKPGIMSHSSASGGAIRVLKRGSLYNKDGEIYDQNSNKPCWWHRMPFDGLPMGKPVKVVKENGQNKVYMDGCYCSYSCVLACIEEEAKKHIQFRDPNHSNSKTLLMELFEDEFPGELLTPSLDWKELATVGNGKLTYKDYSRSFIGIRIKCNPNYQYKMVTVISEIVQD